MPDWNEQIPGGLGTPADPNVGAMLAAANPQVTAPQQGNPYQQIQTELLARMMAAANQPTVMPSPPQQIQGPIAPATLPMQGNGVGATLGNILYSIGRGFEMTPQNEAAQRQVDAENARNQMDYQSQMMQAQRSGQGQQLEALGQASNLAGQLGQQDKPDWHIVKYAGKDGNTYTGLFDAKHPTGNLTPINGPDGNPIADVKGPISLEDKEVQSYAQDHKDPNGNPMPIWQAGLALAKEKANIAAENKTGNSQFDQHTQNYLAAHNLPDTPQNRLKAEDDYIQKTKIAPVQIRTEGMGNNRPMPVYDPTTGQTVYKNTNQINQANAQGNPQLAPQYAPGQIASKEMAEGTKDIPKLVNNYNTAIAHLGQLSKAVNDLGNGDVQVANAARQWWKEQTGNPAPTNFIALRDAVSGEMAKVFKGNATDVEIRNLQAGMSRVESPAQLQGYINTATQLLNSKRDMTQRQYNAGVQGKPDFQPSNSGQPQGQANRNSDGSINWNAYPVAK